jgi:hypothetical protein
MRSSARCRRKDRVLDIFYRRRTMIAGHVQQFRCLLQIAFKRIDIHSGLFISLSAGENLVQRRAILEMSHQQLS